MKRFSIKELERYSGIKAHTIRAWELRHNVFSPERTLANKRHYSIEDVQLLLDMSLLLKSGFRVSQVIKLSSQELSFRTKDLLTEEARQEKIICGLIIAMHTNDIDGFESELDACVSEKGIDLTIKNILIPFLEKVDVLSYRNKSYEAHLVVTAVRKKLILGIERLQHSAPYKATALLFLPKEEHYDLILLYMTYIMKQIGLKILYLGTDISADNLQQVVQLKRPDCVFTYLPAKTAFSSAYLRPAPDQPAPLFYIAEEMLSPRKNHEKGVHYFFYGHLEKLISTLYAAPESLHNTFR
jgi:DNA-binding transcriptional MerR regulator